LYHVPQCVLCTAVIVVYHRVLCLPVYSVLQCVFVYHCVLSECVCACVVCMFEKFICIQKQ